LDAPALSELKACMGANFFVTWEWFCVKKELEHFVT
jgi:hypothetical protein